MSVTTWPPPFSNEVMAPAGEIPVRAFVPSKDQLEWTHKALQVLFMGLALVGLLVLLGSQSPRQILRGAARKHAVA